MIPDRPDNLVALREGAQLCAAVDLGTNSFHLLIARVGADGRIEVLAKEKENVRLGSGSGDMHLLTPEAMDRGIAALSRFRLLADAMEVSLTAVATSALREADNRGEFLARARNEAGVEINVISGVEEARLIHLGVLQAIPLFDEQIMVVDIGGGSTEFVVGQGQSIRSAHSTKLGAIRLTERFFGGGVVEGDAVEECRTYVRSFLVPTTRRIGEFGSFAAVGSSGTINTLARMIVAKRGGDPMAPTNGGSFTRAELDDIVKDIVKAKSPAERAKLAGLDDKRQDIIVGGALLLQGIFWELKIDEMVVSESALREGVLLDIVARQSEPSFHHLSDIRTDSVSRMAELYHEDIGHIQRATDLALQLFDQTASLHGFGLAERDLLEAAGMLHNVGLFISHAAHHKHSYYVIRHSDQLAGFTDAEIELMAQVARYHRKSAPKSSHEPFAALDASAKRQVRILAGILRIAIALDRTRQGGIHRLEVKISAKALKVIAHVGPTLDYSLEQYTVAQRVGLLSDSVGLPVSVKIRASAEPSDASVVDSP